jgi:hypothetical protein
MGDGLMKVRVLANVMGLNDLFSEANFNLADNGTRATIVKLRASVYPELLKPGSTDKKQSSLWFAASVLTPSMDLKHGTLPHPARNHTRWLKWLLWLQKAHNADHKTIVRAIDDAVKKAIDLRKSSIHWTWTENPRDQNFSVTVTTTEDSMTKFRQTIEVISISGELSELDKQIRDDDDDDSFSVTRRHRAQKKKKS